MNKKFINMFVCVWLYISLGSQKMRVCVLMTRECGAWDPPEGERTVTRVTVMWGRGHVSLSQTSLD